jgi:hypothetical protein
MCNDPGDAPSALATLETTTPNIGASFFVPAHAVGLSLLYFLWLAVSSYLEDDENSERGYGVHSWWIPTVQKQPMVKADWRSQRHGRMATRRD